MSPDLARRLIASKRWRWLPGCRWIVQREAPLEPVAGRLSDCAHPLYDGWSPYPGALPDLDDAATLGCLTALVREAWGPALVCVYHQRSQPRWEVEVDAPAPQQYHAFYGPTEGEALASALEAAP